MTDMVPHWTPISLLIFVSIVAIIVYFIGLWAGQNLEREIEADKIKQALKDKEAAKNAKRR
jgi:Na+-transporting methylmalonyl-CoA/oxaloacetate decarboxylase gamma subunit|tara:strand:+ start:1130 stop:1312 length:183 start_codon:yes stop_codon:yes gene_type:complete